jgi:hypothetical protein
VVGAGRGKRSLHQAQAIIVQLDFAAVPSPPRNLSPTQSGRSMYQYRCGETRTM